MEETQKEGNDFNKFCKDYFLKRILFLSTHFLFKIKNASELLGIKKGKHVFDLNKELNLGATFPLNISYSREKMIDFKNEQEGKERIMSIKTFFLISPSSRVFILYHTYAQKFL